MIPIKNIYYMLSYAFKILNESSYKSIETEEFESSAELCAAVLERGVSLQIKRGLNKEYIESTEKLSSLRGKIDISDSIKELTIINNQLVCTFDDFSVNSYLNRVIKSTMELLTSSNISKKHKKELRKLLVFFQDVDTIDLNQINWKVRYNRNNQTYEMLMSICYLVVNGLLQTTSDGSIKIMDIFDDKNMNKLYEKFILEFYRKEVPSVTVSASQIPWFLDDEFDEMLPKMQSDIMLSKDSNVLIIDAKYYSRTTQSYFDTNTIHSGNLYQIFTYVKNKHQQLGNESIVSGMLLYAKTDHDIQPDNSYSMSGNKISVKTLGLNLDFDCIKEQLLNIYSDHFVK